MYQLVKNRHFKRLDEHYVKIGNINILIQPNAETLDLLNEYLGDMKNQVIHIFEIYPVAITNLLSTICTSVDPNTKIFIHIPHMVKDYVKLVKPDIDKLGRKVRFITERKEVIFKYYEHEYPKYFKISFGKDYKNYYIHIYEEAKTYGLIKSQYNTLWEKYPELFRDEIIRHFRKSNPKKIIKAFRTDDEIWEYLIENGVIHVDNDKDKDDSTEVFINGKLEKI